MKPNRLAGLLLLPFLLATPSAPTWSTGSVRMASEALDGTIIARFAAATRLAAQAESIRWRIANAELMGAAACQPKELARVKAEFDRAIEVATDIGRTLEEAEAALAWAEESSAELFIQRQFASSRGIPCLQDI